MQEYWMLCQYPRWCLVSSEKQETASEVGGAREDTLVVGLITAVKGY
jgi:hypothetical protein